MAQVAKCVGVSPSAVSVVLSNTDSRIKVSDATRQRIIEVAREMNYQPNMVARSLRKQRTNIIGFYKSHGEMIDPENAFLGALVHGVLAGCRDSTKNLLMYGHTATMSDNDAYDEVLNGQLDGLVLYSWVPDSFTQRLTKSHLPIVTVADEVPGLPYVDVDDDLGGRLMVRYLVEKNYRRALYWLPSFLLPSSAVRRHAGYLEEAARCGLDVEVLREDTPSETVLKEIMARKIRPEIISFHCDETAHTVIAILNALGFQVPRDIAVTGFDGLSGVYPGLTTIYAPWKEVARTAVSLLVQQGAGYSIPMRTTLPVELVVGETA